jgi:hypothetical protein
MADKKVNVSVITGFLGAGEASATLWCSRRPLACRSSPALPVAVCLQNAGKTTLINHILTGERPQAAQAHRRLLPPPLPPPLPPHACFLTHAGDHGLKIAIIENEYGQVGIDDALVLDTREEIFEMNNVSRGWRACCRHE